MTLLTPSSLGSMSFTPAPSLSASSSSFTQAPITQSCTAPSLLRPSITNIDDLMRSLAPFPELTSSIMGFLAGDLAYLGMMERELEKVREVFRKIVKEDKGGSRPGGVALEYEYKRSTKPTELKEILQFVGNVFKATTDRGTDGLLLAPLLKFLGTVFIMSGMLHKSDIRKLQKFLSSSCCLILRDTAALESHKLDLCPITAFSVHDNFAEASLEWQSKSSWHTHQADSIMERVGACKISDLKGLEKVGSPPSGIWWGMHWEPPDKLSRTPPGQILSRPLHALHRVTLKSLSVNVRTATTRAIPSVPQVPPKQMDVGYGAAGDSEAGHGCGWMT